MGFDVLGHFQASLLPGLSHPLSFGHGHLHQLMTTRQ